MAIPEWELDYSRYLTPGGKPKRPKIDRVAQEQRFEERIQSEANVVVDTTLAIPDEDDENEQVNLRVDRDDLTEELLRQAIGQSEQ